MISNQLIFRKQKTVRIFTKYHLARSIVCFSDNPAHFGQTCHNPDRSTGSENIPWPCQNHETLPTDNRNAVSGS